MLDCLVGAWIQVGRLLLARLPREKALMTERKHCRFQVRVKPRAQKSEVLGVRAGVLEVAVVAPPVEGAANVELVKVLAKHLGTSRSRVRIVRGERGRVKWVEVEGLEPGAVVS